MSIHKNIPFDKYKAWPEINNSKLSLLAISPKHYKYSLDHESGQSKAMTIGTAFHSLLLEGEDAFKRSFRVSAAKSRNSKEYRTTAATEARIVLLASEAIQISDMRDAVIHHPFAMELFGKDREVSLKWLDKLNNIQCKCRIDILGEDAIVDIKTTKNASPGSFYHSIEAYGYHRQAAMNIDAAKANGLCAASFVVIAVEKTPPYAIGVYELSPGLIQEGREEYQRLLSELQECIDRDQWPGYTRGIQTLGMQEVNAVF